jgi:hypothetical protein
MILQKRLKVRSKPKRKPGQRANLGDDVMAATLARLIASDPGKVSLGAWARGLGVTLNTLRARFGTIERAIAWLIHLRIEVALAAVKQSETAAAQLQLLLIEVVQSISDRQLRLWAGMVLTPEHGLPARLCEDILRCIEGMGADETRRLGAFRYTISELIHAIALPDATAAGIDGVAVMASRQSTASASPRLFALLDQINSGPPGFEDDLAGRMRSVVNTVVAHIQSEAT